MLDVPISIYDDRGCRVRLVALRTSFLFPRRPVPLPGARDIERTAEHRAQMIVARARRQGWAGGITWQEGLLITGVSLVPVGVAMAFSWLPVPPGTSAYVFIPLAVISGTISGSIMLRGSDRRTAPQVRAALLADRLCPSCVYDLANSPRDPDGLTPCPECGAAWRV